MGQTLTHGVYLPDEGERNCYDGLAANWQLLDGAVGTIAGKAPAVHTHTKSAITDLLNSNFIPSANNSYNLGSSSYQWNNVYSKGYYYNGTPWGLDKENTWSGNQYLTGMMILNSSFDVAEQFRQKLPKDVSTSSDALVKFNTLVDSVGHNVVIEALGHWANYVSKSITLKYKNDSTKQGSINFRLESSGHGLFYPDAPFECDLGNLYNKWKTLNGINPGALSLPDMGNVENTNYFDFSGSITHLDGTDNFYTPTVDGWMTVVIKGTLLSLFVDATSAQAKNQGAGISAAPVNGYCLATIPVCKNYRVKIQATGTSIYMAFVRPNLGNV